MLGTAACHVVPIFVPYIPGPYVSTSTKIPKHPNIFKKSKLFQKIQNLPKKLPKSQKGKFFYKKPKTASSAASAAFATSTAYLASLVCLIVLKNKAKNKP
jgi:hypothetical protein